jgi:primosomal protein N' (replication factor Y)
VRTSGGGTVLASVGDEPALVIATPGAEPVAESGYAAALLLDAWALLDRADLRAGDEALRRWLNAAALVRGADRGGSVVLVAPAGPAPVEALVRWAPQWHADRELADREALGFPPASTVFTLTGPHAAVDALVGASALPPHVERLGPVPVSDRRPGSSSAQQCRWSECCCGRRWTTPPRSLLRCGQGCLCAAPARTRAVSRCSVTPWSWCEPRS